MSDIRSWSLLGAGNMGEAILRAFLRTGPSGASVRVYDPSPSRLEALADLGGAHACSSAESAVRESELVVLAVKPQSMEGLLGALAGLGEGRLVISVAAGLPSSYIEQRLAGARVVRAMPNTPLLAGKGVVAFSPGASAGPGDLETARSLFPGAILLDVPEPLMDAVTAVSGSGPAYFFAMVEALAEAARQQGLDAETARRLAEGTFVGAAALLEQSQLDAGELRSRVTSPGGTTEAALRVLSERGLAAIMQDAVAAGTQRGRELSEAAGASRG